MELTEGLELVLSKLQQGELAHLTIGGSAVEICKSKDGKNVTLSSQVYFGGNYIPKSVRGCVKTKPLFETLLPDTFLTVDEEEYEIFLNYKSQVNGMSVRKFSLLLEDFSSLAEEWRLLLDENDKNDLIHVRSQ